MVWSGRRLLTGSHSDAAGEEWGDVQYYNARCSRKRHSAQAAINTFIHSFIQQATKQPQQSKAKHSITQHSRHGAIDWTTAQSALSWMPSPPTASHWPTA